jgi:putative methionine-R-sulfoxide reductase with GAF domain
VLDAAGAVVGTLDVESANAQAFTPARVSWLEACARALVPFWARSRD